MLDRLRTVLAAGAIASGNRTRFLRAGLTDATGELVADWQRAFARLEPLEKSEVRRWPGRFLARADDVVYRGKTSGTTSGSFTYFAGANWNAARIAARQRSLAAAGIDERLPMLNLASRLGPVRSHDISLVGRIDAEFIETLLQILSAQSVVVRGYPSRLCEVAVALRKYGFSLRSGSVAAVIATGECLFEMQRVLLKETFDAPVLNEYGSQESGVSGMSCLEGSRVHLDSDRCLYEVVNGDLLTTDLFNITMPMIRYRGGDVLKLYEDECPCGRPGLTAKVLGRQEECIIKDSQKYWPGEIELPAFSGVLNYQIQFTTEQSTAGRRLWVQPAAAKEAENWLEIKGWVEETFGPGQTEVFVEPFAAMEGTDKAGLSAVNSETWVRQVSGQSWSAWLNQPLPFGEAEAIAALLKQVVAPSHIVLQGLSTSVVAQARKFVESGLSRQASVEVMKIRVLLWVAGLMAEGSADAVEFYERVLARFERFGQERFLEDKRDFLAASAMGFDLMAPLLTLETAAVKELWGRVRSQVSKCWPEGIKADAFTMHHYLAILDVAGRQAQKRKHPWTSALRPLSAVLLGDFYSVATTLDLTHIELWAELVHNDSGEFVVVSDTTELSEEKIFANAWRSERQVLLCLDKKPVKHGLERLFETARTDEQVARCWLEKAYATLLFGERLDPELWVVVLREQVGVLGQVAGSRGKVNPMAWVPVLKALAPELVAVGAPELAYACLFASAGPNRSLSSFDRLSVDVNGKQSVMKVCDG